MTEGDDELLCADWLCLAQDKMRVRELETMNKLLRSQLQDSAASFRAALETAQKYLREGQRWLLMLGACLRGASLLQLCWLLRACRQAWLPHAFEPGNSQ